MVGMYSRVVYTPWRNRSDARDNLTLQQLIGFDLWRVKEVDSALFQLSPYKEETNWKQIFILSFFLISHEMKKFLWRFTQSSIT